MRRFFTLSFVIGIASLLMYTYTESDFDEDTVDNKRVLITGGSQNIGKAIALEFASHGAHIVVTARNETKLKEVVKICIRAGAKSAHYIVADMGVLNDTKMVIDKAVEFLDGLDFLVLNHVYGVEPGFFNASDFHFNHAQKSSVINYLSYIYLSAYATPHLEAENGHLVVVSSLAGYIYTTQQAIYGASKAALNHFYSDLRLEMNMQKNNNFSITICLLGTILTEDSRWEKYPVKIKVSGYPIRDTALEIIQGGAMRKAYVFIPRWTVATSFLRIFATDLFDNLYLKYLYDT